MVQHGRDEEPRPISVAPRWTRALHSAHIIARGVTHDGKGLNIAGEYISRGIHGRLEEELTRELGWKSELAIQQEMKRTVDAMRVTTADMQSEAKKAEAATSPFSAAI